MAAAVADFRPANVSANKIKKGQGLPEIILEKTVDILQEVVKCKANTGWPRMVVGFAAESQNLLENAQAKLASKDLDIIAANNILASQAGFGVDTNQVTLLFRDGHAEPLPLLSKDEVAEIIMHRVIEILEKKG